MIKILEISNAGPAPEMSLEFGERLNLLTGDNGLGKSFLLDIAWWAMTRVWPAELNPNLTSGKTALPVDKKREAKISYWFSGSSKAILNTSTYDPRAQNWPGPQGRPGDPGLVFYALADGSFAVWDPARNHRMAKTPDDAGRRPDAYVFSPKEVWDGLQRPDGSWLCNGLIRDWAGWQKEKGQAFEYLKAALRALSPPSGEKLVPGDLTRISLDDVRDMPTLRMPYGQEVAVVHASAGIRRIISLAYFLVWCWEEHLKAQKLQGKNPDDRVVFLIDEVEAHLHPKWQRMAVPALMKVMDGLMASATVQLIAATHSPLIMASVEPIFESERDAWFDLDLAGDQVVLNRRQFVRQGDATCWLTSEAFDLQSGYSIEAEAAREQAAHALEDENLSREDALKLHERLKDVLSDTDPFWMRWRFVGEKRGWLQ